MSVYYAAKRRQLIFEPDIMEYVVQVSCRWSKLSKLYFY